MVVTAEGTFFLNSARRVDLFVRAYSSIGQSPRLITGPFLVRTQVGPPLLTSRERSVQSLSRSPGSVTRAPTASVTAENGALSASQGAS